MGKIGVSEDHLSKPSTLTPTEYAAVQEHSAIGAGIIEMIPFLEQLAPLVMHHHERFDGRGYPDRIAGEDIPLGARILAVADAFDAITTGRPYRPATQRADAVREIIRCSGTQFAPTVVDAFVVATDTGALRWRGDHNRRSA